MIATTVPELEAGAEGLLEPLPAVVVPELELEAGGGAEVFVAVVPDAGLLLPVLAVLPAAIVLAAATDGFADVVEEFLYPEPPHPTITAMRNRKNIAETCRTEPPADSDWLAVTATAI